MLYLYFLRKRRNRLNTESGHFVSGWVRGPFARVTPFFFVGWMEGGTWKAGAIVFFFSGFLCSHTPFPPLCIERNSKDENAEKRFGLFFPTTSGGGRLTWRRPETHSMTQLIRCCDPFPRHPFDSQWHRSIFSKIPLRPIISQIPSTFENVLRRTRPNITKLNRFLHWIVFCYDPMTHRFWILYKICTHPCHINRRAIVWKRKDREKLWRLKGESWTLIRVQSD